MFTSHYTYIKLLPHLGRGLVEGGRGLSGGGGGRAVIRGRCGAVQGTGTCENNQSEKRMEKQGKLSVKLPEDRSVHSKPTRSKGSVNLPQGSVNLVVLCKVY